MHARWYERKTKANLICLRRARMMMTYHLKLRWNFSVSVGSQAKCQWISAITYRTSRGRLRNPRDFFAFGNFAVSCDTEKLLTRAKPTRNYPNFHRDLDVGRSVGQGQTYARQRARARPSRRDVGGRCGSVTSSSWIGVGRWRHADVTGRYVRGVATRLLLLSSAVWRHQHVPSLCVMCFRILEFLA